MRWMLLLLLLGCAPSPECERPHASPECGVCCHAHCGEGHEITASCDGLGNAWCGGEVECDDSECWPIVPVCECSDECLALEPP